METFQAVVSTAVVVGGLIFALDPIVAVTLVDFAHLVLGDRNNLMSRKDPRKGAGYLEPRVVARSPALKRGYRFGGVLMTCLGVLLLFRALAN